MSILSGGLTFDDRRPRIALICLVISLVVIAVMALLLPEHAAKTFLDKGTGPMFSKDGGRFPFSVQTPMWILFFVGLGELYVRYNTAKIEHRQLGMRYLPEDETTVLVTEDVGPIYSELRKSPDLRTSFLPRLIDRCIVQFQSSNSIDQAASLLNTSVEMFIHEVDLRYNMLRFICWMIPSFGFIGTVIGIGDALTYAGDPKNANDAQLLTNVTNLLAVSFEGTFVALVLASILVFMQNVVQSKEEHALNQGAQYCLDNLINRLYVVK